jgi:hypothetical protein
MGFDADEYDMKHRRTNWRTILLPVMGFLLAGMAAAIAFALVEMGAAKQLLQTLNINSVPQAGADFDKFKIAVGIGIFMIVLLIFATIYGIFAPKPTKMISEKELDQEKKLREKEKLMQRRRRRQVNINMAKERREKNAQNSD